MDVLARHALRRAAFDSNLSPWPRVPRTECRCSNPRRAQISVDRISAYESRTHCSMNCGSGTISRHAVNDTMNSPQ